MLDRSKSTSSWPQLGPRWIDFWNVRWWSGVVFGPSWDHSPGLNGEDDDDGDDDDGDGLMLS